MPIVFKGPDPVAPEIAAAYGAAQVSQQNLPALAQQYAQQAQMSQQRNLQTAQLGLQAREGDLNRMTQGANIVRDDAARQQALQQQNQQFFTRVNAEQNQEYFRAEAAAARQVQSAQLQAWVNEQELSQKEKITYQRMQNAIGQVNSDPNLSKEEKQEYLLQLKTGIDPLEQRMKAQQNKLREQQVQELARQAKLNAELFNEDGTIKTAGAMKRILTLPDPNTGKPTPFFMNAKGDLQKIDFDPLQTGSGQPKSDKPGPFQYDRPFQYSDYQKEAEAEANVRFPVLPNSGGTVKDINAAKRAEYLQQLIEGYKANHVARQQGQGGGQQQQQPADPSQPPFELGKPKTPDQQQWVRKLEEFQSIALKVKVPDEQKAHSVSAAVQAKAALAQYGSPQNMERQNPQLYQQYIGWLKYLDQLPKGEAPAIQPGAREASGLPRLSPIDNADERRPWRDLNNMPGL